MTLQDLIDFLVDQAHEQTLTDKDVTRCMLLAYEMGGRHMREELQGVSTIPWRLRAGNFNLSDEAQRGS